MDPIGISQKLFDLASGVIRNSEYSDLTAKFLEKMAWIHGAPGQFLPAAGGAYMPVGAEFHDTIVNLSPSTRSKADLVVEKARNALGNAIKNAANMGGFTLVSAGPS